MENFIEIIKTAVKPVVEKNGYELVDVLFKKRAGTDTLTVIIWKKGDMSLSDCELVHNAVGGILDDIDFTDGRSYNFEVSSMGLDYPLKSDDDFRRRTGEELEIKFYAKVDGKKSVVGVLEGFDDEFIYIADGKNNDEKQIEKIERKSVAKASAAVKF